MREHSEGENRHWHAAGCQATDDAPVDRVGIAMHEGTAGLGHGGVEQVRAHRGCRVYTKEQDEQGCHKRSPAHPGHPDQRADAKSRERVQRGDECPPIASTKYLASCWRAERRLRTFASAL